MHTKRLSGSLLALVLLWLCEESEGHVPARRSSLSSADQRDVLSSAPVPDTFVWKGELLAESWQRVHNHDPSVMPAMEALLKSADSILKYQSTWTVVSKNITPPSGDKHDYMSVAIYYWPCNSPKFQPPPSNCNTTTGLPWIGHDGVENVEAVDQLDSYKNSHMTTVVNTLSLAYYFSGDERYASKAVDVLEEWFLKDETKMNPNLNFAQGVPGRLNGSSWGIIDTVIWIRLIDSLQLLSTSPSFSSQTQKSIHAWFAEYTDWLFTSKNGKGESDAENNHGTWYDSQVSIYSLFGENTTAAQSVANQAAVKRINKEIQPDGQMPLEERRTKSKSYCLYNLEAFLDLADLSMYSKVNLYNYTSTDGRSLQKAIDFIIPYATGEKTWPFKQIVPFEWLSFFPVFRRATYAYGGDKYENVIAKIGTLPKDDINLLLYPAKTNTLTTDPHQGGHHLPGQHGSYIQVQKMWLPKAFLSGNLH